MLIAQKGKSNKIVKATQRESCLLLETEKGKMKIEPYSEAILRISYTLAENFTEGQKLGTLARTERVNWEYHEEEDHLVLSTRKVTLNIRKDTAAFSYFDDKGSLLTREPSKGGKELEAFDSYITLFDENSKIVKIATPDGEKEVVHEAKKMFNKSLFHSKLEFEWSDEEALYGLGQQEEGSLNLRGTRQYLHQANMKIAIPMLLSTRRYGILFDTYSPVIFNDNEYGSYLYNIAAEELDYYFIHGECFDDLIAGYRKLSGMAAMLPKWAFGYMQSQERYESQSEIIETVMEYRRRQLPIDSIVLDWQSWEEGMWGQKTFDESRFPDAKKMTDVLHEMDARLMISIWPNMHKETANYSEMKKENCLFMQSEIYNAFDEKARKLYWKQSNEGLFSKGIDGWWCDSSEPVTPEWNVTMKPEADHNFLAFHNTAKIYMDEAYTNAYPLMHARSMYEGQRSVTQEKRVVNLTRSGYTGQQRYGVILWSGDTSAKWKTLKNQIPAGLNLCASGLPYWTLDIGAFFVKKGNTWFWDGEYEDGNNDLGYRELYTRWFQFGTFQPIFRAHGTDTRREIWHFGEEGEIFYDTLAKFDTLRYQLLPYIYSLAGMVTLKEYTIMRLLAFDYLQDPEVYGIKDQYMFGKAMMICPVTMAMYYEKNSTPLENVAKTRSVYLPKGTPWYDFWTGEKFEGGQSIQAKATIDILPIFIPAGSIIPMAEGVQSSSLSPDDNIILRVYPGADGSFTLYQDEKDNYHYEQGEYVTIDLLWDEEEYCLTLSKRKGGFKGMAERIVFEIEVVGVGRAEIQYNGDEISGRILV